MCVRRLPPSVPGRRRARLGHSLHTVRGRGREAGGGEGRRISVHGRGRRESAGSGRKGQRLPRGTALVGRAAGRWAAAGPPSPRGWPRCFRFRFPRRAGERKAGPGPGGCPGLGSCRRSRPVGARGGERSAGSPPISPTPPPPRSCPSARAAAGPPPAHLGLAGRGRARLPLAGPRPSAAPLPQPGGWLAPPEGGGTGEGSSRSPPRHPSGEGGFLPHRHPGGWGCPSRAGAPRSGWARRSLARVAGPGGGGA